MKKPYKIQSFKRKTGELGKRGKVGGNPDEGYPREERFDCQWQMYRPTVDEMLKNEDWEIYSIERLSDGEVFTVGDKIKGTASFKERTQGYVTIERIYIVPGGRYKGDICLKIDTGYVYTYHTVRSHTFKNSSFFNMAKIDSQYSEISKNYNI